MKFCHYRGISLVTVLVTWQCSHCRCFWSFGALYKKLVTWLEVQILPWKWPVRNPHFQPSKRYGPFKQLVSQLSMYAGNISYIWHKVLFQGCFFEAIQLQFVYFWPKSIKIKICPFLENWHPLLSYKLLPTDFHTFRCYCKWWISRWKFIAL